MAHSRENFRPRPSASRAAATQPTGSELAALDSGSGWLAYLTRAAVIVFVCLWVYSPVTNPVHQADWLWDDDQLLTQNLTVQHKVAPDSKVPQELWNTTNDAYTLSKLWFNPDGADYFPLSYSALWAQWPFFQMDPRTGGPAQPGGPSVPWPTGYHATSVVLHIIGSLLLWRLFAVMKIPAAWLGGLLFAVHPVCVESVAWVSELKNTLSLPLFLIAAICFVKFDDAAEEDAGKWWNYGFAVAFFLLAMFAKTSVVAMPVVLLLYAWWKRGAVRIKDLVYAVPFFIISIVLGLITIHYQHSRAIGQETIVVPSYIGNGVATYRDGTVRITTEKIDGKATGSKTVVVSGRDEKKIYTGPLNTQADLEAVPAEWRTRVQSVGSGMGMPSIKGILTRLGIAGTSVLFYLATIFWPVDLLPIYTRWEIDLLDLSKPSEAIEMLTYLVSIPVILGGLWWCWQKRSTWGRHALFAIGFFLLMVAPVLGFITISYMRITWAADHFIYLPMISLIALVAAVVGTSYRRIEASDRQFVVLGSAAVVAILAWLSFGLATTWINEDELWTHTLQHNENAWQAHNRLGAKKFARGHVDTIAVPNEEVLDPATKVKIKGAFHHFTRSTALRPDLGETHNNLGTAFSSKAQVALQQGNQQAFDQLMDKAVEQFKDAVIATPHVTAISVNLANAMAAAGRFAEAETVYFGLIDDVEKAHAQAVQQTGNPNLSIDPGVAALYNNYGVALYKQGKKEDAIKAFRRALAINPNVKDARESLAMALGETPESPSEAPASPEKPSNPAPIPLSVPQSPTLGR